MTCARDLLLTDGVIVLDRFKPDDVDAHVAGEDEEHARRFGWYPNRSTAETARAAFARWDEDKRMAEISYWTFPTHRGRGLAARAVRLACSYAFAELRVERIEAYIEPDNVASRRVVEAAGFLEEGLVRERELTARGERRDMALYGLLPRDLKPPD